MSEYKIAETFEVNDDADFILDDLASDIMVNEDDDGVYEEPLVVSEEGSADDDYAFDKEVPMEQPALSVSETIPGTDLEWAPEEEEPQERDTNWADDGDHTHFISYVKDKMNKVPRHSGNTIPGCERACAFLKSIDSEISKAMRSDLDGKIDETEIDAIRKEIEQGIERLESQIKRLRGKKADLDVRLVSTGQCRQCDSVTPLWHDVPNDKMVCLHCEADQDASGEQLTKNATTPVLNVYVSPFERAIVGTIVNSKVSAGRNIEETYELLKSKYNFTPREELAIQQLVADYGYPVFKDRGRLNEVSDPSSGDSVDWNTNYYA